MDNFLLKVMAYVRFVAICHPLELHCHYESPVLWPPGPSFLGNHVLSFPDSSSIDETTDFFIGTEIPYFFCELTELLRVAGSETLINNIFLYVITALLGLLPVTGIIFSYFHIISSLLRMSSTVSKYKAFSTCGSHLCVVSLFYGTGFVVHLSSAVTHSSQRNTITSIMYTVVTSMLNPIA
jgi:olfactory receptor